jgi:hypothetical protein
MNSKNHKDFLKDVWSFKRREGLKTAVTMYAYAWLGCKMGNSLK